MITASFLALYHFNCSITTDNKNQIHLASFNGTVAMCKASWEASGVVGRLQSEAPPVLARSWGRQAWRTRLQARMHDGNGDDKVRMNLGAATTEKHFFSRTPGPCHVPWSKWYPFLRIILLIIRRFLESPEWHIVDSFDFSTKTAREII